MPDSILQQVMAAFGGPWIDRAKQQTADDIAAYQQGGLKALMTNTQGTQDLAGGFGGTIKSVGPSKIISRAPDFGRAFLLERNRTPANAPEGWGLPPEAQRSAREQLGGMIDAPTNYNVLPGPSPDIVAILRKYGLAGTLPALMAAGQDQPTTP